MGNSTQSRSFLLVTILYLLTNVQPSFLSAQAPVIEWQKSYGTIGWDEAHSLIQTSDGGFIVAGKRSLLDVDIFGCDEDGAYLILKLDTAGEIEWSQCYGGLAPESANCIIETNDGGYIICGYSYANDGDVTGNHGLADCWIVKINSTGTIEWQKSYGGTNVDYAESIIQTFDGGYVFCAYSNSEDEDVTSHHGIETNEDYWVVKIDAVGNIEWEKSYGGDEDDNVYDIVQCENGDLIVAGKSNSENGDVSENYGSTDIWLIRLNAIGELIWEKSYGGTSGDIGYSIAPTIDNGIILSTGTTWSNDFDVSGNHGIMDIWLVKIDSTGNLLWQKCLGGTMSEWANDILATPDSCYLICGGSTSNSGDVSGHHGGSTYADCWIVKIDFWGNIKYQQSFGGSNYEEAKSILLATDNKIVFTGFSRSNDGDLTENNGDFDYWIVKLGFCNTHYYADDDGDGFGNILIDSVACNLPLGFVLDSTDCNDANNLIHPFAADICNSMDDNCNGEIDEDALFIIQYADEDGDGFGDIENDSVSCFELAGFVLDSIDCNDADVFINPAASEICNGIDDNCNFDIDEGLTIYTLYADADGDSFGNVDAIIYSCLEIITGYVLDSTDCDDTNNLIYPGTEEFCNYLDDDCDGIIDDNLTYIHSYQDADEDDFGNIEIDSLACTIPFGYVTNDSDCDDTNPNIYPGSPEILNGLDDDCDGFTDEGLAIDEIILNSIHIYPNPTAEVLHIDYFGNDEIYIEVLNITGQILFSDKIISPSNEINMRTFAPGMYVLRIYAGEKAAAVTFEKQ